MANDSVGHNFFQLLENRSGHVCRYVFIENLNKKLIRMFNVICSNWSFPISGELKPFFRDVQNISLGDMEFYAFIAGNLEFLFESRFLVISPRQVMQNSFQE